MHFRPHCDDVVVEFPEVGLRFVVLVLEGLQGMPCKECRRQKWLISTVG